jgi:hypothetical protein
MMNSKKTEFIMVLVLRISFLAGYSINPVSMCIIRKNG